MTPDDDTKKKLDNSFEGDMQRRQNASLEPIGPREKSANLCLLEQRRLKTNEYYRK